MPPTSMPTTPRHQLLPPAAVDDARDRVLAHAQPLAQHLAVSAPSAWLGSSGSSGTPSKRNGECGTTMRPKLGMVLPLQRAAGVHVGIVDDLVEIAHRRARHMMRHEQLEDRLLRSRAASSRKRSRRWRPCARRGILERGEARVVGQLRPPHGLGHRPPVRIADADDGDPAVGRRVDVVGALGEAAVAVAGARRRRRRDCPASPSACRGWTRARRRRRPAWPLRRDGRRRSSRARRAPS